jgi:hypothetical protein
MMPLGGCEEKKMCLNIIMVFYAMADGRSFTSYLPNCRYEAEFARSIGASSNMEYRAKLSDASSMCLLNKKMAQPVPGDGHAYNISGNCGN